MIISTEYSEMYVAFIARVFLGLLFFYQGYDKIFCIKVKNVVETIHLPLVSKGVPKFFSIVGAYFTSYVELICGAALILGFAKYYSLYLLGFDILFVSIAFGLVEPMWDTKHIFPRILLLIFLLIIPSQWDLFSIDTLLRSFHLNFFLTL
ncbi:MAG: DoxX family membrane protein [Bacteroidia bacterium]